jgi:hypothetical protein
MSLMMLAAFCGCTYLSFSICPPAEFSRRSALSTHTQPASDHLFQLITRAYENVALIITWLNSYNLRLGLLVIQVEKGD